MEGLDQAKLNAAVKACEFLNSNFNSIGTIGLGTGSTIKKFINVCKDLLENKVIVPSSFDTAIYLVNMGYSNIRDPITARSVDVYIDGADEVSEKLDMVKGRGGAFLREKSIALRAKTRVYVIDHSKFTGKPYLYLKPIPIEVIPAALPVVLDGVKSLGNVEAVLRMDSSKDGPVVTDNGNFIIDLRFTSPILEPAVMHERIKRIHGVVETGIFPSILVDYVVVGYPDKTVLLQRGA
jgi:ribose 5-phosphate isomerase A